MPPCWHRMIRVKKSLRDGFESGYKFKLNRELKQILTGYHRGVGQLILNTDGLTIASIDYMNASFVGRNFAFRPLFSRRPFKVSPAVIMHGDHIKSPWLFYFSYPVYERRFLLYWYRCLLKVDLPNLRKRFANQNYEFLLFGS